METERAARRSLQAVAETRFLSPDSRRASMMNRSRSAGVGKRTSSWLAAFRCGATCTKAMHISSVVSSPQRTGFGGWFGLRGLAGELS